VTEATTLRE